MATAKKPAAAAKKPVAKAAPKAAPKKAVAAPKKVAAAPKAVAKPAVKTVAKAAPKAAPKKAVAAPKAAAKPAVKRTPNAAFMKPLTPSAALAEVVGAKPLPRTEVTKKVWEYIKKHNLQNPENKRNIDADDKLKAVFGGKKQVSMFEMTKLISGHLK